MLRISMNEITTYSWTFDEDVRYYGEAGYAGIGVWRQKLTDFGVDRGTELLRESGLAVSNLLWVGGFTGSDGRGYRDSIDDAIEAIGLAAAMRAECLVVYSGSRAGHTLNHARRMIRNALRELRTVAETAGVSLAIEPVHAGCGGEWSFLHGLEETLDLIRSLESPAVGLAFDTYHLGQAEVDCEQIKAAAPWVRVVHLGDSRQLPHGEQNRCLLGDGQVPIRSIIVALQEGGFDGFFDVELFGEDVEQLDYRHVLQHSKQAIQELISV